MLRTQPIRLSAAIYSALKKYDEPEVSGYREYSGLGIEGAVLGNNVKIGSLAFVDESLANFKPVRQENPRVYVSINGRTHGYFEINNSYRKGIENAVRNLSPELPACSFVG